ncbi:hypothetical protein E5163_13235 [Marinicauda algicola]|uniref:EAL domain-containing protein n=1 Tax=Marinicauda algicola TaxID=2029849 RepID=A0A4S2GXT5_9PROT|nr:hypothetical protein [Marinicauda algicola]TGY87874.1 hypothetical protein E5163_13235 [Marinicauda algicola]
MGHLADLKAFREVLAGSDEVNASQFKFLNLEELAERYGDRWPKVKARIFETCHSFIEKRIGPRDLMLRAANGFLVLPSPDRPESAAAFAARLETELKTFFLGTDYLRELDLHTGTIPISVSDLLAAADSRALETAAGEYEKEGAQPCAANPGVPEFALAYQPVWASASGHIALRTAMPAIELRRLPDRVFHRVLPGDHKPEHLLAFDLDVLARVTAHARDCISRGRSSLIAAPVHFQTLCVPRLRMVYAERLSGLPEPVRKVLGLRIMAAPADAPAARYAEATRLASLYCRRVFVDIDFEAARLDRFHEGRLDGFVIRAPRDARAMRRARNALVRFQNGAARLRAAVAMADCVDRTVLAESIRLGVSRFSGTLFPRPASFPRPPEPFDPFLLPTPRTRTARR